MSEQPTEWTVEYREAEDGSCGAWTSTDGSRGGESTTPTRYRRYVTPWVLDRPRERIEWSVPPPSPLPSWVKPGDHLVSIQPPAVSS